MKARSSRKYGGNPASIAFREELVLDDASCSRDRVPIAHSPPPEPPQRRLRP